MVWLKRPRSVLYASRTRLMGVAVAALLIVGTLGLPPIAVAFAGSVLYTPDTVTYPTASANYTGSVRLAHSGAANGRIIAAHDNGLNYGTNGSGEPLGIRVYKSDDNGKTWSNISVAGDLVHGWQMFEPALFELPVQIGSGGTALPAGTLLLSTLAVGATPQGQASPFGADMEIYKSADQGATWSFLSSCDSIPVNTQVFGAGIWEPTLNLDSSNNLVCYFSDERASGSSGGPGNTGHYSQMITHRISTNGGQSWGSEVFDIAVGDGVQRPGMPQVVKLPNGTYFMTYEVCGQPDCQVRYRTSSNGTSWGTVTNLGTTIQSSGTKQLGHAPYVTWSPSGGSNGTLFVSAMHVNNSDGSRAPQNGKVIFANTNLGSGNWSEISAPLTVNYGTGECPGWRQALEVSLPGTAILQFAPTALNGGSKCEIRFATGDSGTLPFYAPLASGNDAGWATYGGTWSVSGEQYTNSSTGSGDKATIGSTAWTDYTLQADVRMTSSQNAGVVFRVTNPAVGADALTGYYFGIDGPTGTLVLGKQNNSWTRLDPGNILVSGGVSTNTWYHLTVQVIGCALNVAVQRIGTTSQTTYNTTDGSCFAAGQVGVRSFNTGASWRNVSVTPGGTTTFVPAYAPWGAGSTTGWTTYGGSWALSGETWGDSTVGTSGDKAVTGLSTWGNSSLVSDLKVTSGTGTLGLIARVTNPAVGADAYTGYFAGIDRSNSQVVLGRANNSWTRLDPGLVTVPGGVSTNSWYHMTFQHVGCALTVTAQSTASFDQGVITYTDTGCTITNGKVGIRDYNAAATWRYFTMLPR
jgi:hypothetical protein